MPRPMNFFRLDNASKDSGMSFHCRGKPDDLIDEPLDFINERRRSRKNQASSKSEEKTNERQLDSLLVTTLRNQHRFIRESRSSDVLSPSASRTSSSGWSLQSFLFGSTPPGPNPKRNSRIKKLWCKKPVEPLLDTNKETVLSGTSGGNNEPKSLRSVQSMPLLGKPIDAANRQKRCRSKCLSPSCLPGLDRPADDQLEQEKSTHEESVPHTDRAKVAYSKPHPATLAQPSKNSSFLSMVNWGNFFLNRHQRDEKLSKDKSLPTS